jgi:hypothetical protein
VDPHHCHHQPSQTHAPVGSRPNNPLLLPLNERNVHKFAATLLSLTHSPPPYLLVKLNCCVNASNSSTSLFIYSRIVPIYYSVLDTAPLPIVIHAYASERSLWVCWVPNHPDDDPPTAVPTSSPPPRSIMLRWLEGILCCQGDASKWCTRPHPPH